MTRRTMTHDGTAHGTPTDIDTAARDLWMASILSCVADYRRSRGWEARPSSTRRQVDRRNQARRLYRRTSQWLFRDGTEWNSLCHVCEVYGYDVEAIRRAALAP